MLKLKQQEKKSVNSRFSENATKMMRKRYLATDEKGVQETPAGMFVRVANSLAQLEKNYGKDEKFADKVAQDFFEIMASKEYTPAGRTLTNAGSETPLIANCIVLPIHDSMESIFQTLKDAALLQQAGSGLGFDLSEMRPADFPTKKSRGRASGPVSFLKVYDAAFGTIKQQCFAKGTRIVTKRGLIPIEEVRKGDETYTEKGWKKVTEVFFNGVRDTLRLTLDSGFSIELTPNHKVAVLEKGRIVLKEVQELTKKDVLLLKLGDETNDFKKVELDSVTCQKSKYTSSQLRKIRQPKVLDEDFAYFLGWYFADGCSSKQGVSLAIPDTDASEDFLKKLLQKLFAITKTYTRKTLGEACRKVDINSMALKRYLVQNGLAKQYAHEIEVPEKILRSPGSVQMAFVAGFFDGDGDNGRNYRLNTSSKTFAQQLQLMLLNNGIGAKIKEEQRRENWRIVYRVGVIGRNSTRQFYKALSRHSWKIQKKEETKDFGWIFPFHPVHDLNYSWSDIKRLHEGVRSTISHSVLSQIQQRAFLQEAEAAMQQKVDWTGFLPVRMKSIKNVERQQVYDFEVEDVHMINAGLYTKNSRHGANMSMMRVDHPDILDFITCKAQEGEIRNFNISVTVTDEFMEQLEKEPNKPWMCVFEGKKMKPRKVFRHPNGAVDRAEDTDITVKGLFDILVEHAWLNGEPGIAFIDTINRTNPLPDLGPLASSNPCIAGDTLVATEKGLLRAEELVQKYEKGGLKILTDQRVPRFFAMHVAEKAVVGGNSPEKSPLLFSDYLAPASNKGVEIHEISQAFRTGVKKVVKIVTKEGYELTATPDHKILTTEGWIEAKDSLGKEVLIQSGEGWFNEGTKLPFESPNEVKGRNGHMYHYNFPTRWSKDLGQVLGWLIGDGWLRDKPNQYMTGFTFGGEDRVVMAYLKSILNTWYLNSEAQERIRENGVHHLMYNSRNFVEFFKNLGVRAVKADEKEVPSLLWYAPRQAVVGFLQGLFTADGTVRDNPKSNSSWIALTAKNKKLLQDVQILLLQLGIKSQIFNRSRPHRERVFSYVTKDGHNVSYSADGVLYELGIFGEGRERFRTEIGFLNPIKQERLEGIRFKRFYTQHFTAKVIEVISLGEKVVYDLTEPVTHSMICNGLVVHQCGEQFLHPYDNCNLGSLNLALFVKDKKVDYKRLKFVTRTAVRLMDNVIDKFDFPVPQVTDLAQNNRRIGLGIMGFADLLYQLGVRYDSKQGLAMAEKVMGFINKEAYLMSQELAKEKGAFANYEKSVFAKKNAPHSSAQVHGIGKKLRNAALTTVAPTGSISMMFDTSSGIEPNFALAYIKQDKDGQQYHYFNAHFKKALERFKFTQKEQEEVLKEVIEKGSIQHLDWLPKELRDTFVVAMDISGRDHMRMQAAFQKNVDNSISKTVNFKNEATRQDIADVFVEAWKLECKACTVYRDGSRVIQILNVGSGENIIAPTEAPGKGSKQLSLTAESGKPRPRPEVMSGKTYRIKTGYGNLYVTVNNDEKGNPFEVFATIGKSGGFFQEQSEAICRLISLALRAGVKVENVVNDLKGIRGPMPVFTDKGTVLSLPDALGKILEQHATTAGALEEVIARPENQEVLPFAETSSEKKMDIADFGFMPGCPDCGAQLTMQEGCISCKSCGFSRCS